MPRLSHISVRGLFGIFDHELVVRDPVTIIHGPNGVGKTILLGLVRDFFLGNFDAFQRVPFSATNFTFTDKTEIGFTRKGAKKDRARNNKNNESDELIATLSQGGKKLQEHSLAEASLGTGRAIRRLQELGLLSRTAPDEWLDLTRDEMIPTREAIARFGHLIGTTQIHPLPEWLENYRKATTVKMISTQRIETHKNDARGRTPDRRTPDRRATMYQPTVEKYAEELVEMIQGSINLFADRAQMIDRTFPSRLISGRFSIFPNDEIPDRLRSIEVRREHLQKMGILDPAESKLIPELQSADVASNAKVLSLYISDMEEKLSAFDQLAEKLDLFASYISRRFRWKRMHIRRDSGVQFSALSDQGQKIPLRELSSGEQHALVLWFDLLFRTEPGTLLLIDEPEISFNLLWQEQFLDDLITILKRQKATAIVATHSAQIIGEHWSLVGSLRGPISE